MPVDINGKGPMFCTQSPFPAVVAFVVFSSNSLRIVVATFTTFGDIYIRPSSAPELNQDNFQ
jgi:hypothetical protein